MNTTSFGLDFFIVEFWHVDDNGVLLVQYEKFCDIHAANNRFDSLVLKYGVDNVFLYKACHITK